MAASVVGRPRLRCSGGACLFSTIRHCEMFVTNARRSSTSFLGTDNWLQCLLYRIHPFTQATFRTQYKIRLYHFLPLWSTRYKAANMSNKSTPPMLVLYSVTDAGHGTSTCFLALLSHRFTIVTGSTPTCDDEIWTARLSNHRTIHSPLLASTTASCDPRPFLRSSDSDFRLQPRSLLALSVPTE